MIQLRPSRSRGHFDHGWLDTYHTFSFGGYVDPDWHRFGSLRVLNDDRVAPGQGFGTHPHRDMEIVTYVLAGALEHRDSMGNGEVIRAGEIQRMTAGTGITHSEFNPSDTEEVHLLQIWLFPEAKGLEPSYEQIHVPVEEKRDRWRTIAARETNETAVTVHQNASIHAAVLTAGTSLAYPLGPDRKAWLHVVSGEVRLGPHTLGPGDSAGVTEENGVELTADAESEVLLFDVE